jgi:hypothetical protein
MRICHLFVAPMTITGFPPVFSRVISSMQDNSCATIRRSISLEAVSLFGVIASISSMKIIQGA